MRYRRTPCLTRKQMAALEEEIKKHPEREEELREQNPRNGYIECDDDTDNRLLVTIKPYRDTDLEVDIDKDAGKISIFSKK